MNAQPNRAMQRGPCGELLEAKPIQQVWPDLRRGTLPIQELPVQAPLAQAPLAQAPLAQAPLAQAPLAQAPLVQAPLAQTLPSQPVAATHGDLTPSEQPRETIGCYLRRERALRGLSLEELAQVTRIPVRSLQYLEADRYDALPSDVFVRGFLRAYARALGVDGDEVLERYADGRCSAPPVPAALPAIAPPERGRRFGIAIALVILLILFTLALSIVLQPRHRDTPIELSSLPRIEDPWVHAPHCSCAPSTTASATASSLA